MSTKSGISVLKTVLICFAAVVVFFVGSFVYVLAPKLYYMKSEYVTADVIRDTDRFVSAHPGEWPHSWHDIGGVDLSRYTDMRFNLTTQEIISNKSLIYTAIQPKCHQYRTYPHARAQLRQSL
jgi:hypothetical protein